MQRIVVIGCAGSGKSTLARLLASQTGLPLVERDALGVLGSAGYLAALSERPPSRAGFWTQLRTTLTNSSIPAADTVIFLDCPKPLVLWGVLRRTLHMELAWKPAGAHQPQGLAAWRDHGHPVASKAECRPLARHRPVRELCAILGGSPVYSRSRCVGWR